MKTLPRSDREQVLNLLVEGNSMQATTRLVRCSFNTVKKLLVDAGEAAAEFHDPECPHGQGGAHSVR